jgi:hypothetical protein
MNTHLVHITSTQIIFCQVVLVQLSFRRHSLPFSAHNTAQFRNREWSQILAKEARTNAIQVKTKGRLRPPKSQGVKAGRGEMGKRENAIRFALFPFPVFRFTLANLCVIRVFRAIRGLYIAGVEWFLSRNTEKAKCRNFWGDGSVWGKHVFPAAISGFRPFEIYDIKA